MSKPYAGVVSRSKSKYITSVELRGADVTDGLLAQLHGHKHLRELHLVEAIHVTNAGLTYIENLRQLEWLNLDGVAITDRGLFFIQQMTKLRGLHLTNAFITSSGLEYLLALKRLEYLELSGTNVSDDGLRVLAKLKCLRTLRLSSTAVTDTGIRRLQTLKKLGTLVLYHSHVTAPGLKQLQKQLPNCEISWSAYEPPVPIPAKLPIQFQKGAESGWLLTRLSESPQWYLKHINDSPAWYLKKPDGGHILSLNQRPQPDFVRRSHFNPSQPSWIELLDW